MRDPVFHYTDRLGACIQKFGEQFLLQATVRRHYNSGYGASMHWIVIHEWKAGHHWVQNPHRMCSSVPQDRSNARAPYPHGHVLGAQRRSSKRCRTCRHPFESGAASQCRQALRYVVL